ncbi:MAG: hypothetical protein AABW79_02180 [Nanoarchaeota archaeon]
MKTNLDSFLRAGLVTSAVAFFGWPGVQFFKHNYDNEAGLRAEVRGVVDSNRDGLVSIDEKQAFYKELGLPFNDCFNFTFEQGKKFLDDRGIKTPYSIHSATF